MTTSFSNETLYYFAKGAAILNSQLWVLRKIMVEEIFNRPSALSTLTKH